ncbi:MAG: hypothetical protein IIU14_00875 [Ruminococcus sp.]|nr:hypothetical protein [Ruminococcus sp.]
MDMENKNSNGKRAKDKRASYQVTDEEIREFAEKRNKLANKLNGYIIKYEVENDCSRYKAAEYVSEQCQQSWDSFKKIFQKKARITRELLYKFCIGMHLTMEEAEELFALSEGGPLSGSDSDHIFINAVRDGDDIFTFIEDYEKCTGKKISMRERKM